MRHAVIVFVFLLSLPIWCIAQETQENKVFSPNFRFAIGSHPFNLFHLRDAELLPINLEAQFFVRNTLPVGASFGYDVQPISRQVQYYLNTDSLRIVNYNGKSRNYEFLVRANYYFELSTAENWILRKLEPYLAVGFGVGRNVTVLESEFVNTDYPFQIKETPIYFAHQLTVGLNYNYGERIGFYFETGIAMAKFQLGVVCKL